jgi:hypothetical protein
MRLSKSFIVGFDDGVCLIRPRGATTYRVLGGPTNGLCQLAGQAVRGKLFGFSPIAHDRTVTVATGAQAKSPSLMRWHKHLGHMGQDTFNKLVENGKDLGNLSVPCDICVKAKHRRTIIRKPVARMMRPFQLIHLDLCSLLGVRSVGGALYFIV